MLMMLTRYQLEIVIVAMSTMSSMLMAKIISNVGNVKSILHQYCIHRNVDDIEKEMCIGHE